ncbi:hypothetical protein RNZ50_15905 [Paracoccaceae bacterium Fryx2]|nr:hypothetical protein [Paracoccaceae bacterium Fryx2]
MDATQINATTWLVTQGDEPAREVCLPVGASSAEAAIAAVTEAAIPRQTTPAEDLTARRAGMVCSRMQGILALGETRWAKVLAYRATATWPERVIIDSAGDWLRESQNVAFFACLVGFSDTEVDDLFETAAGIAA